MRSSQNKPELKDIKSRNVQEEGDTGYFGVPSKAGVTTRHRTNFIPAAASGGCDSPPKRV